MDAVALRVIRFCALSYRTPVAFRSAHLRCPKPKHVGKIWVRRMRHSSRIVLECERVGFRALRNGWVYADRLALFIPCVIDTLCQGWHFVSVCVSCAHFGTCTVY